MSDERDIEAQIKAWASDTAERIPAWRVDRGHDRRASRQWERPVAALAAAAALVGVLGWWATADDGQTIAVGGPADTAGAAGPTRTVDYERFEYRVTSASMSCPEGLAGNVVSSVPIVFEAWADRTAKVWKNVVTYPNGETRQVVAEGSAYYPTGVWVGGAEPSPPVGCADPSIDPLAAEPGQGNFVSLNPLDTIPTTSDGNGGEMPMVQGYQSLGVRQPEPTVDSQGRPCTIWRQATPGSDGQGRAIHQHIDWCVDTDTGKVLELTWSNARDGIGIAETRQTLVEDQPKTVPATFMSSDGLRRVPNAEFPNGPPSVNWGPATTVVGVPGDSTSAEELAEVVARALELLNPPVTGAALIDSRTTDTAPAGSFTEVRLDLGAAGELQASIRRNDAAAAKKGTDGRGNPFMIVGSSHIYIGIDSPNARSVELFDGSTIIYVRSEQTSDALHLLDLAAIAIAVKDRSDEVPAPATPASGPPNKTIPTSRG